MDLGLSVVPEALGELQNAGRHARRGVLQGELHPPPSDSRNRLLSILSTTIATRGSRSRNPRKSLPERTRAVTWVDAVAVAEQGRPSIADCSPIRSPGPRIASITSRPSSLRRLSLTKPLSSTSTRVRRAMLVKQRLPAHIGAADPGGLQRRRLGQHQRIREDGLAGGGCLPHISGVHLPIVLPGECASGGGGASGCE